MALRRGAAENGDCSALIPSTFAPVGGPLASHLGHAGAPPRCMSMCMYSVRSRRTEVQNGCIVHVSVTPLPLYGRRVSHEQNLAREQLPVPLSGWYVSNARSAQAAQGGYYEGARVPRRSVVRAAAVTSGPSTDSKSPRTAVHTSTSVSRVTIGITDDRAKERVFPPLIGPRSTAVVRERGCKININTITFAHRR
jgi:hypothetical protein